LYNLLMFHVAILIETSGAYGRGLLRGVAQYHREHLTWSAYFRPRGPDDPLPRWLKNWHGDGILARIRNQHIADQLLRLQVPVVNLRQSGFEVPGVPTVELDHRHVGIAGAEHLLSKGLSFFGFVGSRRGVHRGHDARADAFAETVTAHGAHCELFKPLKHPADDPSPWEREQSQLVDWLTSLPKPIGVMASNDEKGLQVLDACQRAGVRVPDEVAVIGVDNDQSLCDLAIPPMSSVDVNPERVGYRGAALLDEIMHGRRAPAKAILVPPRGVVARRSTDVLAGEDAAVVELIRYLRDRAANSQLRIADVLQQAKASRASIEPRVKRMLGRTLHQELERVRLERARELLATSETPIKQVAKVTGFNSVQYLTRVFRRVTGETPARYRADRSAVHAVSSKGAS
jgi:LacI family transcriptional regulator